MRSTTDLWGQGYKRLLDRVRANDWVAERIWGLPVHAKALPMTWDLTSICLKKALDRHMCDASLRYLDMGCGQLALLGQYAKSRWPTTRVVAVDLYADLVEVAATNALGNGFALELFQGDLFEAVEGSFDVISFNPPYVPHPVPESSSHPFVSYSAERGTQAADRFLAQARAHLRPHGLVLLGINCFHVNMASCLELIEGNGWVVEAVVRRLFNSARVFVLRGDPESGRSLQEN